MKSNIVNHCTLNKLKKQKKKTMKVSPKTTANLVFHLKKPTMNNFPLPKSPMPHFEKPFFHSMNTKG